MNKLRIGVIFGGRSGEHEVSIASAASIFTHLDPERYEAVPIRIEKDGRWVLSAAAPTARSAAAVIAESQTTRLDEPGASDALVTAGAGEVEPTAALRTTHVDVVFRFCTVRTGKTGRCRGCWSSRAWRTWAPVYSDRRSAWTRR